LRRLFLTFSFFIAIFFASWLSTVATRVEFPSFQEPPRLYSNQIGDDLHLLFCEALAKADRSIYLEMYSITDTHMVSLLKNQALQGRKIEIIADKGASPWLKKKIGSLALSSIDNFYLYKGPGLMHRKIVVIDEELILLGSTNFTKSSLNMHDNLVLAIRSPSLGRFCQNQSPPWNYSSDEISIWKLPEMGEEALDVLCSLLSGAKKTIRVAMFTFSHKRLAEELIDAHARGVDVQVALDHYTREGSSKKIADLLIEHGIPLLVSQGAHLLHHKWALIDGKTLVSGSANWTLSAFKKNKDLLFLITPLNKQQRKTMKQIWQAVKAESSQA
jgi:cardiolipin synthase A/B